MLQTLSPIFAFFFHKRVRLVARAGHKLRLSVCDSGSRKSNGVILNSKGPQREINDFAFSNIMLHISRMLTTRVSNVNVNILFHYNSVNLEFSKAYLSLMYTCKLNRI